MKAKISQKAWLGIEMDGKDDGYYEITSVIPNSPAESAGFQTGDVLVAMNDVSYAKENIKEVKKEWGTMSPGSSAKFIVRRQGEKLKLKAQLGHVPDDMAKKWIAEHMEKHHSDAKMAKK